MIGSTALLSIPVIQIINSIDVSWIFIVPGIILVILSHTFISLWIFDSAEKVLEPLLKKFFSYAEIKTEWDMNFWCKENIKGYWIELNETYYFMHQRDAMAFKLAWI